MMRRVRWFHVWDYVVFGCSLFICMAIGMYHALHNRRKKGVAEFLMASRDLQVFPLTLSLVVSVTSAVALLGVPAEMYTQGSQYVFNFGSGLGIILTAFVFVPLLHPLKLTSMFEFLERRFQSKAARLVGSVMEILALVLYGGVALFAPATALEGVSGLPSWVLVVSMGLLVTVYTALGGMRAVIWTDVFQAVVMLTGLLAVMIQGLLAVGGFSRVWELNQAGGRLNFYKFDVNPTTRHTFWGLTVGFAMGSFAFYGASQFIFQRFAATKNLKDARLAVLLNLPTFYIFHLLLCGVGLVIYAFYANLECDPLKSREIKSANQLLPVFVMDTLGNMPGLPGLFVASLTSAALSTISSVMNSVGALVWEDFVKPKCSGISDFKATLASKFIVVCIGVLIVILSFIADSYGPHIFQVCFALLGATGGPQLGMFLLGAIFPQANWKGALVGCGVGVGISTWITLGTFITKPVISTLPATSVDGCLANVTETVQYNITTGSVPRTLEGISQVYSISYVWYTSIGVASVIIVGLLVSFITGPSSLESVDENLILPWYRYMLEFIHRLRGKSNQPAPHTGQTESLTCQHDANVCSERMGLDDPAVNKNVTEKEQNTLL